MHNQIPKNWQRIRLIDIGKAVIGLTYQPRDVVEKGGILVFRSSNIRDGKIDYRDQVRVKVDIPVSLITQEGDILICARNGSRNLIGKSAYITNKDIENTFGAFMSIFRTKNSKFVYYLFQSQLFKKEINKDLGPTINQVTTGNLHTFRFLFPPQLEKDRIVAVLETWDKAIELLEKKIEIKKKIKKGLMQKLLTGKTRIGVFHKAWHETKLGDVCTIVMGQSPSSAAYNENVLGLPLIQGNNDIKKRKTVARIWTTEITKSADKGNIVMTVRAPVGLIGLVTEKACIGRGVCAIIPEKIDYNYILKLLEYYENKWRSFEQGSTFTAVNSSDIKNLKINIPTSGEEQKTIADILTTVDNETEKLQTKLSFIKDQKKYLLNNLITGAIRTPEDLKIN